MTRLRSVDTNPEIYPSRTLSERFGTADCFAKRCSAMCAVYSEELASRSVKAETWWVRFVPEEGIDSPQYGSVAMTVTLGLGEVHSVPFDPAVVTLPEHEVYEPTLDWLHAHMLQLAEARGWDESALHDVYQSCTERLGPFTAKCNAKWDHRRRFRAAAVFEIDARGDGWTTVTVVDRNGTVIADERFDSPCEPESVRGIGASLRWKLEGAAITPWPDKFLPQQPFAGERIVRLTDL